MSNPSKQKGTAFETLCLNFLRRIFPRVFRPALQGGGDTGDINGVMTRLVRDDPNANRQVIFQCKNAKKWDLSGWLNATRAQAFNNMLKNGGIATLGVLLVKRRGIGAKNMEKTYAIMELGDLSKLLTDAGYE